MKRTRDADPVHRFIDIEATVDEEGDEEEDDEEDNGGGFIEDAPTQPHYTPFRKMDEPSNRQGGWTDLVASIGESYASGSERIENIIKDDFDTERQPLDPTLLSCVEDIARHTTYPFWRVRCKVSSADAIITFLHQIASPRHEMLSAFKHPMIKSWIYLEATMNEHLRRLLTLTPGIIVNQSGIICERIDTKDGFVLLKMQNPSTVEIGKWVQIRKGIYKGDLAYVKSTTSNEVQLLLIPRLLEPISNPLNPSDSRPAPALFDCDTVKRRYNIEPVPLQDNIYSFHGQRFEYGLILKSYASDLISTPVSCMPWDVLTLFLASPHPTLIDARSAFPKPLEWHFAEGDEACISDSSDRDAGKTGIVATLRNDSVELSTEEGIISVPWLQIRKVVRQGQFVEITGGEYLGCTGWVGALQVQQGSLGNTLYNGLVANVISIENNEKALLDRTKSFDVSINFLKLATVPHVFGTHPLDGDIGQSEQVPWTNMEILVIAHGNPYRQKRGVVKDVICNQPTPSGLRVVVEMNSNLQSPSVCFDYDGVVEASFGVKLHHFVMPKSDLFIPRNTTAERPILSRPLIQQPSTNPYTSPGYSTPIPDSPNPLPSSPAWDPSSRTPHHNLNTARSLTALAPSSNPLHALLDVRLLGAQLKVFVTGGKFNNKELFVSVQAIEGRLTLQYLFYKAPETLQPEWVTPKHPNPTRDNGLLIVIKGDHCGKFVRRIHHRYEGDKAIVILAVVNRVAGHVDTLSGENVELDVSHLCVCEESRGEKEQNRQVMTQLREEARKTRAK